MAAYTREELDRINALRHQEQTDRDRRSEQWYAAGQGYSESDTEYRIQYQIRGREPAWFWAQPFYEPLSAHADWTDDAQRADEIADLLLEGRWGVTKQDARDCDIVGVRVVETDSVTKIISQRHRGA